MKVPFRRTIYAVGLWQVAQSANVARSYYNLKQDDTKKHLQHLFGDNKEWAVVTGASEGIGEEYAIQLARSGFNLVLISRTKANLEKVAEKAKQANPAIETQVVPYDLSKISGEQVKELFDQRRYSIVVNNAGRMQRQKFMEQDPYEIQAMMNTNIRPYILFTKYATLNFLAHAHEHTHKVALIHTASVASDLQMPFASIYSGTKRFNDVFGQLVAQGHSKSLAAKQLIVTQILKPSITTTRLADYKTGKHASTVDEVVGGSLADLGRHQTAIYGSLKHSLAGWVLAPWFFNWAVKHMACKKDGNSTKDGWEKL